MSFLYIDPFLVAVQGVQYGVPTYNTATLGWLNFDIIIDVPEVYGELPPEEPLILHHQNTYKHLKLVISPEWTQYLLRTTADVYFTVKRYSALEDSYFHIRGQLSEDDNELLFDLTAADTTKLPPGLDVYWEMKVQKGSAPDFFRVIINGRVHVEPTLRRID